MKTNIKTSNKILFNFIPVSASRFPISVFIFLLLTFNISLITYAQRYPGDPDTHDSLTTEPANESDNFIEVYDWSTNGNGKINIMSWWRLKQLMSLGINYPAQLNNWTANQTYLAGILFSTNGYLQLPSSKVGTFSRQPFFDATDSTLYITDASGTSIPFKSQSYNDNVYATSSGATNLGATYMTLATAQTVTAAKTFSSTLTASYKLRIPYGTLPEETTGGFIKLNSANNYYPYYTNSNGTWKQIVTLDYLEANYPSVTGYAVSVGTQSLNPVWNFTGTLNAVGGKVKIKESTTLETGEIGYSTSQGESGLYIGSSSYIPDDYEVDSRIASNYSYENPEIVTAAIDTIDFTADRNFIKAIYQVPQDGLSLKLKNTGTGTVTIIVYATQESVAITSLGTDPIYRMGDIEPDYLYTGVTATDTKYKLTISRYTNGTRYEVDVEWTYLVKQ